MSKGSAGRGDRARSGADDPGGHPATMRLRQLAGVGPITVLAYVLEVEDPTRFAKSRDVGPFVALVPREHSAGEQRPELGIPPRRDAMLRRLLVQAAHYTSRAFSWKRERRGRPPRPRKGASAGSWRVRVESRTRSASPTRRFRILACCELGKISTIAAGTRHTMGLLGATALDGGIRASREAGYPLEPSPPTAA